MLLFDRLCFSELNLMIGNLWMDCIVLLLLRWDLDRVFKLNNLEFVGCLDSFFFRLYIVEIYNFGLFLFD